MTQPSIAVIDYGSGNLRSVCKAFEATGAMPRVVSSAREMDGADAVVVPGVGAFADCAANLQRSGLWAPLQSWVRAGRPYLGICLGYQLLFESSEESPGVAGMGLLSGTVVRFPSSGLKVPHMGWNALRQLKGPLFGGIPEGTPLYFVHSFYPVPADASAVAAVCDYGGEFAAAVSRDNVYATQFHPEKSQAAGLAILGNFLKAL